MLLHPKSNVFVAVSTIALQLFLESYTLLFLSTIIDVNPVHLEKAERSIDVTLLGISIEVRLVHPEKAP